MENLVEATRLAFTNLWEGFFATLLNILGALIVFFIGWAIAVGLQKLVVQILRAIKIDQLLEKVGAGEALQKAGLKLDVANWIGFLVKWFLIFGFLLAAVDILGLTGVSNFLGAVLAFIPNIIVAAVILVVGVWGAGVLQKLVLASIAASHIKSAAFVGTLVKWSVLVFTFIGAIDQLKIFPLLNTLITGLIAMLAIAGGLAFGLGGKEQASRMLGKMRDEMFE
ncbi:MAG: hypothetical protein V1845_00915 [bacterium]